MTNYRNLFRCLRTIPFMSACAVLLTGAQLATAQSFTWDKIDAQYETLTTVSAKKALKTQIVTGNARLSSNRAEFEDWYRKYLFPAMASLDHMGSMYSNRDSLAKDLERAVDAATHQLLVDLAYDEAVKRVTGNYHPAVRFNAMLIIGKLNQVEVRRADRLPPVRLPKAFDFLLSEYKKADQIDVLRFAAMVGIERHLRLVAQRPQDQPIADGQKAEVASLMLSLAQEKSPGDRDAKIHTWLRRRAIDLLATMKQVGDGQSTFNALVAIAGDEEEPIPLRCTAARAIGELDYTGVSGIDTVATAQKLGALVAAACRHEDTWIKEKQKELEATKKAAAMGGYGMGGYPGMGGMGPGASGMGPGMPGAGDMGGYPGEGDMGGYPGEGEGDYGSEDGGYYGSGMAAPKETEEQRLMTNARRRLKLPILYAQLGIRGQEKKSFGAAGAQTALGSFAQLAVDDAEKEQINKILEAIEEINKSTDSVEEGLDEMLGQVRTRIRELEGILPKSAAAQAEESKIDDALPGADDLPGG